MLDSLFCNLTFSIPISVSIWWHHWETWNSALPHVYWTKMLIPVNFYLREKLFQIPETAFQSVRLLKHWALRNWGMRDIHLCQQFIFHSCKSLYLSWEQPQTFIRDSSTHVEHTERSTGTHIKKKSNVFAKFDNEKILKVLILNCQKSYNW